MLKRFLTGALAVLLLSAVRAAPAAAPAGQAKSPVEKVKASVARRAGKKKRVTVKLQDGSKLKGNVSEAGEDSFTLTDNKTGQSRTLAYSEVSQVKGTGLSRRAKIGIGVGIGAAALAIAAAVAVATFDPFSGGITAR
jgi:hypothetical protein